MIVEPESQNTGDRQAVLNSVFIVHGHDNELKQEVARFVERLDLNAIIFHEQSSGGKTIIEKFEEYSKVGFAVVLLTPDDIVSKPGQDGTQINYYRARQNVIFEMGFSLVLLVGRKYFRCYGVRNSIFLQTTVLLITYMKMVLGK